MSDLYKLALVSCTAVLLTACTAPSGGSPAPSRPMPPVVEQAAADQTRASAEPGIMLSIDGNELTMAEIESGHFAKGTTVVVSAHTSIPYSKVIAVYNQLFELGFKIAAQTHD